MRYLAIKHEYAPPSMLSDSDDVDRFAQTLRRDMIKNTVEGRKKIIEDIKKRMKEASTGEKDA